jgi:hypothetical protein
LPSVCSIDVRIGCRNSSRNRVFVLTGSRSPSGSIILTGIPRISAASRVVSCCDSAHCASARLSPTDSYWRRRRAARGDGCRAGGGPPSRGRTPVAAPCWVGSRPPGDDLGGVPVGLVEARLEALAGAGVVDGFARDRERADADLRVVEQVAGEVDDLAGVDLVAADVVPDLAVLAQDPAVGRADRLQRRDAALRLDLADDDPAVPEQRLHDVGPDRERGLLAVGPAVQQVALPGVARLLGSLADGPVDVAGQLAGGARGEPDAVEHRGEAVGVAPRGHRNARLAGAGSRDRVRVEERVVAEVAQLDVAAVGADDHDASFSTAAAGVTRSTPSMSTTLSTGISTQGASFFTLRSAATISRVFVRT